MDDMYNGNNREGENGAYGGNGAYGDNSGRQPYPQSSVQDQLRYSYSAPMDEMEEPMTLGDWMITLLIQAIPCVGIVMLFVWAFSQNTKKSKANYCRAALIYTAIGIVFVILNITLLGASMISALGGGY